MTKEQLKKAKAIADAIEIKKELLNIVQSSDRLELSCKSNEYLKPVDMPFKYRDKVRKEYAKEIQDEIDELQKQFDEL